MIKPMLSIISIIILIYIGILFLVYLGQNKLLFFPGEINTSRSVIERYSGNEIIIHNKNIQLHGWFLRPDKSKIIIYYGGNAEEVSLNLDDFQIFKDYGIVLINFRGYGKSQGKPGQDELFSDALFIFDYIHRKYNHHISEIILFGRSLGSGVATYVASQRGVNKLILVSPYDSITNIAKIHFPYLPVNMILKHPFNSMEYAQNINMPVLILSAENDNIIPFENTKKLNENFTGNVTSVIIENTDHNTIQISNRYWSAIKSFLGM